MKPRTRILCLLLILVSNSIYAQQVTMQEALDAAKSFILYNNETAQQLKSGEAIEIESALTLRNSFSVSNSTEEPLGYLFKLAPSGFVVTSANKQLPPILAYSNRKFLNPKDLDYFISFIIEDLKKRHEGISLMSNSLRAKNILSWEQETSDLLKSAESIEQWPEDGATTTGGWIETTWHQGPPYNIYMPIDPITNQRSATGCVSTSLAQIINYHKNLAQVEFTEEDRYTVNEENFYQIKIDADHSLYDFPSFDSLNQLLESVYQKFVHDQFLDANDIAALQFACAISLESGYSSYGTAGHPDLADDALKNKFNYQNADYLASNSLDFYPTIITNIQEAKPCLLSIKGPTVVGHSIVVDGYRTDGFYHLNFGWGESSPSGIMDAWYMLPQGMPFEYNMVNATVCNICPRRDSITIEPKALQLLPDEAYKTNKFQINCDDDQVVSRISGNNVVFSLDSVTFESFITSIEIAANNSQTVWVRYEPADTMIIDNIKIEFENGHLKYVYLKGYPDGAIIDEVNISGNWADNTKPYLVLNDIVIDNGNEFVISEGVKIYLLNHSKITVKEGRICAKGTASNPVVFTSLEKETGWNGIRLINSGDDDVFLNCQFTNSYKVENNYGYASFELQDAIGGALYCENSSPSITNCFFSNNKANITWAGVPGLQNGGGAIGLNNSSAEIVGCVVVNNLAKQWWTYGGGLYILNSNPRIVNSTIARNEASIGGGVYSSGSEIEFINTIIWDNYAQGIGYYEWTVHPELVFDVYSKENVIWTHSILRENYFKNGVIDSDPRFTEPSPEIGLGSDGTAFNWSLLTESPAINNGTLCDITDTLQLDIYGNTRTRFSQIDIGAVECQDSSNYLTVLPFDVLSFEPIMIGDSLTKSIKVINTGNSPVSVNYHSLTTDIDSDDVQSFRCYELIDNVIEPSDTAILNIVYKPSSIGKHEAMFIMSSDSRNYPEISIPLKGMAYSGQLIEGEVSGTWEKDDGPYNIVGDIWVKKHDQLQIMHGSEVVFYGSYKVLVESDARLLIKGIPEDSVSLYGLDNWQGIHITDSEMDEKIEYCSLEDVNDFSAINIVNSQPYIANSSFRNNQSVISISGGGAIIDGNDFKYNTGSVISGFGKILIQNNVFDNNDCSGTSAINYYDSKIKIVNNIIKHNISLYGPIHGSSHYAGIAEIVGNLISNNRSTNYLAISAANNSIIRNNIITNNYGICPSGSTIISVYNPGSSTIVNNTICNNEHRAPAVRANNSCDLLFSNNILWNNSNCTIEDYNQQDLIKEVSYSDIDTDTISGQGTNINSAPLFISPSAGIGPGYDGTISNWQLTDNSPCVDRGNPDTVFHDLEDSNNPGFALLPSKGTIRNDIGAYGGGRNMPPRFDSFADTIILSGKYFESNIRIVDADSPLLFINAKNLPGWLMLKDNNDGTVTLSGTPSNGNLGDNQVSISVTDGAIDTPAELGFILSVVNISPELISIPDTTASPKLLYTYHIEAWDENGDSLVFSYNQIPHWLSLTDNKDGTASLSGMPSSNDIGEHQVSIAVADGICDTVAEQAFIISVVNRAPEFISIPDTSARPDLLYTYQIEAWDDNGDSLIVSYSQIPDWLMLSDNNDGTADLSGTPLITDLGEHQVTISVTDRIIDIPVEQSFIILVDAEFTGSNAMIANSINIYPNPASSKLFIDFAGNAKAVEYVTISSISGVQIMKLYVHGTEELIIDIDDLRSGTYLLSIKTSTGLISRRIVKH